MFDDGDAGDGSPSSSANGRESQTGLGCMSSSWRHCKRPASVYNRRTKWTATELHELAEQHSLLGNKWKSLSKTLHKTDTQVKNIFHSILRSKNGFEKCPTLYVYAKRVECCADNPEARRLALCEARDAADSRSASRREMRHVEPEAGAGAKREPAAPSDMLVGCPSALVTDQSAATPERSDGGSLCSAPADSAFEQDVSTWELTPADALRPDIAGDHCCRAAANADLLAAAGSGTYQTAGAQFLCLGNKAAEAGCWEAGPERCDGGGDRQPQAPQPLVLQYDPSRDPLLLLREHSRRSSELNAALQAPQPPTADSLYSATAVAVAAAGCWEAAGVGGGEAVPLVLPEHLPGLVPTPDCALWSMEECSPFVAPAGIGGAPGGPGTATALLQESVGRWPWPCGGAEFTCCSGNDLHDGIYRLGAVSADSACGVFRPDLVQQQQDEQYRLRQQQQKQQQQQQRQQQHGEDCESFIRCAQDDPLGILVAQLLQQEEDQPDTAIPLPHFGGEGGSWGGGSGPGPACQAAADGGVRPLVAEFEAGRGCTAFQGMSCGGLSWEGSGWLAAAQRLSSASSGITAPAACLSASTQPEPWTGAAVAYAGLMASRAEAPSADATARATVPQAYPPPVGPTHVEAAAALAAPVPSLPSPGACTGPANGSLASFGLPQGVGCPQTMQGQTGALGSPLPAPFLSYPGWASVHLYGSFLPAQQQLTAMGSGVAAQASGTSWGSALGGPNELMPVPYAPTLSASSSLLLQPVNPEPQLGSGVLGPPQLQPVPYNWQW